MLYSASAGNTQFSHFVRAHFIAAFLLVSALHVALVFSLWVDKAEVSPSPEVLRMVARTHVLPAKSPVPALRQDDAVVPKPAPATPAPVTPPVMSAPRKIVTKQSREPVVLQKPVVTPKTVVPQKSVASPARSTALAPAVSTPAPRMATPATPVTGTAIESAPRVEAPVEVPPRHDVAYLQNPAPAYPVLSRRRREEGTVYLQVWVGKSGNPDKIAIARSSGFSRLDEAARQTVMRWRFVPARRGNTEIDAQVTVPVVFRLNR